MAQSKVSEAVARPMRGVVQSGPAFAVIEIIEAYELYNFTDRQYGVTLIVLTSIVSAVQNFLENRRGKGFFLRTVPNTDAAAGGA